NCLGITNNVEGVFLHMLYARPALRGVQNGVAFVGQSGGLLGHFQRASDGRGVPLSYVISTGNEAGLETTDFIEFLVEDRATRVIAVYAEHIQRPAAFLAACHSAHAAGETMGVLNPRRRAKAQRAAHSPTGALVGGYRSIRV